MARGRGWHAEDIKAALRKKYGNLQKAAAAWGTTQPSISNVLTDASRSMKLERRISEDLSISLHELWPDRWNADGTPKPRPRAVAYELRPTRNSQNKQAA